MAGLIRASRYLVTLSQLAARNADHAFESRTFRRGQHDFLIPMLCAFATMRNRFNGDRHGEIRADACTQHILRIGQSLLALGALVFATPTLQSLALTADNPVGTKIPALAINSNMIGFCFSGAPFVAIGRVMREAAKAASENAAFV